jgi:hypothetical protein
MSCSVKLKVEDRVEQGLAGPSVSQHTGAAREGQF